MGKTAKNGAERKAARPSVATHPAFPAIVALWFAALLGIGFLVLPAALLEGVIAATGLPAIVPAAAPPLGLTARMLLGGTAALVGAILGFLLARKVAGMQSAPKAPKVRRVAETRGLAVPRPLNVDEIEADRIESPAPADDEPAERTDPREFGRATLPGRRRALAVTDESSTPSEFLYTVPVPGGEFGEDATGPAGPQDIVEAMVSSDPEPAAPMAMADPVGAFARPQPAPALPVGMSAAADEPFELDVHEDDYEDDALELGAFAPPQEFESEPQAMSEPMPEPTPEPTHDEDPMAPFRNEAPAAAAPAEPIQDFAVMSAQEEPAEEAEEDTRQIFGAADSEPPSDFAAPASAPFAPPAEAASAAFAEPPMQDFAAPTPSVLADPLSAVIEQGDEDDEDSAEDAPLAFAAPSLAAQREAAAAEARAREEAERLAREEREAEKASRAAEAQAAAEERLEETRETLADAPLGDLVERLGAALRDRPSPRAEVAKEEPVIAAPAPDSMAAESHQDEEEGDIDLSALDFSLPLHAVEAAHLSPRLDFRADEPQHAAARASERPQAAVTKMPAAMIPVNFGHAFDAEDFDEEYAEDEEDGGYSSLLAMRNPFADAKAEPIRIDLPEEDEDDQPMVVFPGQSDFAARPAPVVEEMFEPQDETPDNTVPFARQPTETAQPARPKMDFEESERALREALANLQRNQGGRG
ncbi:hypothetical protein QQS45_04045 [Alteriqipengyuania flavescens]|uniref:hypothetical protein n=1 Tax=Alteriqipengyuania flavescens TaxID=3053610 RepID=UPI0025B4BBA8|nr:hypothetical protein [Alteriqipengyuania flavescens]WJY19410.1 hypothetical protein QQW98_04040 [Alteriqipengyuania flavescens]WJY25352.1 hypothetical protein QQS45_04045 [Alteriqipengyuania flavescens]